MQADLTKTSCSAAESLLISSFSSIQSAAKLQSFGSTQRPLQPWAFFGRSFRLPNGMECPTTKYLAMCRVGSERWMAFSPLFFFSSHHLIPPPDDHSQHGADHRRRLKSLLMSSGGWRRQKQTVSCLCRKWHQLMIRPFGRAARPEGAII